AKTTLRRLELHVFPKLGTRPIADITSHELLSVMRGIEQSGVHMAHRMLQVSGQVFTYAIITQRVTNNPAVSLQGALKPWVKQNRAYIKPNELPEFLKTLDTYDGTLLTKLAVKFLLLTFVRTGEMRGAQWSEIDFDKAEWRIPAERMKVRQTHIVPLSRQAAAILQELRDLTGQGRYVFPNQNKPTAIMSENTVLYALYRMGYHSRATGHGFRSTASTVLHEQGYRSDVIERQLAHVERNQVKAAYNHAQYLPERRKMMQWWADYLDRMAAKTPAKK
ncbi:MAG: tyrosine-type recombinase/integrase, partial [Candidatus Binatia bacterium]